MLKFEIGLLCSSKLGGYHAIYYNYHCISLRLNGDTTNHRERMKIVSTLWK